MLSRVGKTAGAIACMCATVLAAGCAHTAQKTPADTVSGYYAGNWYGPNPDRPLGELNCTIVPSGPGAWQATFAATFGGFGEYEVALEGRAEGDKVLFDGEVDLGETSGGVFKWTGEISGDAFNGAYTSSMINGTFRMQRAQPPAE